MRKESQLNGKESQQLLTFIDNNGQNNTRTTKSSKHCEIPKQTLGGAN